MRFRHVTLALGLALMAGLTVRAEIIEQILVKVNGEIFTKTDLEQRQIAALRQRNRQITQNDIKTDAELRKALSEITPQIIVQAVDELLLVQRGREMGYQLTDERFNDILTKLRKDNNLESEEQFVNALKGEGLTLPELRRQIERDMLINQVQQQDVMQKISVTEAEEKAYFEAHRTEFTTPATVTLREILVNVPDKAPAGTENAGQAGVNVGLDEEAKAKADALRLRVAKEDFAKVAAAESDAPSKANGGLIGPINRDELSDSLQKIIANMKPGQVSEVIRIAKGYQLIKLESQAQTVVSTMDQVRDQVANKVFMSKRGDELQKYLKRLRAQAIIEWKNDEIKRLYEAQTVDKAEAPTPAAAPKS